MNKNTYGYVYAYRVHGYVKIGCTKNVLQRRKRYVTESPYQIDIVFTGFCDDYTALERSLHIYFADKRVRGEWFEIDDDEDIHTAIRSIADPGSQELFNLAVKAAGNAKHL